MQTIPTYAAAGQRVRNSSLLAIQHKLLQGECTVERNHRGKIVCAYLTAKPLPGQAPRSSMFTHLPQGQAYSYEQQLPSGHRAWTHLEMLTADNTEELAEAGLSRQQANAILRDAFQSVVASVGATVKSPVKAPRRPSIVSILAGKARRQPCTRPVEFDSQLRAA